MIGHDVTAALPELRAQAESLMVTPCTLEREDGYTIDPNNAQRVPTWAPFWEGLCKVLTSREARVEQVGGQDVTAKPTMVSVPWDAPRAHGGDRFVTDRGTFYVAATEHHSLPIQQRYSTVENQG